MPNEPYNLNGPIDEEEYRRRALAKAKRRKKRQMQRLLLLAGFAVAAILLIVVIVILFRNIFGGGGDKPVSSAPPSSFTPVSVPEPEPQFEYPIAPDPSLWSLQLVNVQHPLEATHRIPDENLTSIVEGVVPYWFDNRITETLQQMIDDCNAQVEGGSLHVTSGYRGPDTQNARYQRLIDVYTGQGKSAAEADVLARQIDPPSGLSEHQIGLAVDFVTGTVTEPIQAFDQTPEFQWLMENAANYGFILRYPQEKEAITGILYQPYHWRYVGNEKEDAHAIMTAGICLEEYMAALPATESDSSTSGSGSSTQVPGTASSATPAA